MRAPAIDREDPEVRARLAVHDFERRERTARIAKALGIADGLGFSVEGARKLLEREAERQLAALHSKLLNGTLELPIPSTESLSGSSRRGYSQIPGPDSSLGATLASHSSSG